MSNASELENERLASTFRPNRRPLWIAVAANGSLALLLLGVPYWRGQHLATVERRDFAQFARCLIGGEMAAQPGLSIPRGDREHFAGKFLFARADWPMLCRPALQRLAPPDAFFLWPSVKQAGADLRAAVTAADRELTLLDTRRKHARERIPERPLAALKLLQGATVLYARAAGADADLDNDAIRFDHPVAALATPARLPLMAGSGSLDVWSSGLALEAVALDGRGLSYVHVADGKIDRDRVQRTSFLRGVVRAGSIPYLVWAMPDSRCDDREDHCAGRPTGIARYERGATKLSEPTWKLSGHPGGRIDRVLSISELGRVELVARASAAGALELLSFRLPEPAADGGGHKTELLEPIDEHAIRADGPAAIAILLPGEPSAVLYANDEGEQVTASLAFGSDDRKSLPLTAAAGTGAWSTGCTIGETRYLAYGSSRTLRIARVVGAQPPEDLAMREVALRAPLDGTNPALDDVRLVCDEQRAHLLYSDQIRALAQISCDAAGCGEPRPIASDIAGYSALSDDDGLIVAYAAPLIGSVVHLVRLDRDGQPSARPITPAACWEPLGGMCGVPTLVRDAQRLVLAARDGADLLALESTDRGRTFTTLSGLVIGTGFEDSTTSPLKQHRLKKGLE